MAELLHLPRLKYQCASTAFLWLFIKVNQMARLTSGLLIIGAGAIVLTCGVAIMTIRLKAVILEYTTEIAIDTRLEILK